VCTCREGGAVGRRLARVALVLAMVEGGSKGRGSRGRGASSRPRGRGAEPPPPRPPRREETPAHNHEPAADADGIVADDEEYLALATSITNMMRDEVACRDKLLKRVSDLESALTAAQHGEKCQPPAWPVRLLRLFRARLLWMAWHSQGRETGSLGAQPLPRLLERTYSFAVDATHPAAFELSRRHARRWRTCARATTTYKRGCVMTQVG
jgi:hypothetical protein